MNGDEQFEQRLRRQSVKPIPPGWREQILQQATAASHATRNPQPESPSLLHVIWQRLFWPHPKAWAGLAAVWLVALGLNLAARDSAPRAEVRPEAVPNPEMRRLLKQQELLYAELIDRPLRPVAEPLKLVVPGPQSRRHEELFLV